MSPVLQLEGELVSRKNLEALNPQQFSSILLLADSTAASGITDADSRNLATLLLLRDIQAQALKGAAASELLRLLVCFPTGAI
jgi:hypothetical protein